MDGQLSERREFYTENGYVILRQLFHPDRINCLAQTLRFALPEGKQDDWAQSIDDEILSAEAVNHQFIFNASQAVGSSAAAYNLLGAHALEAVFAVTGFEPVSVHVLPMYCIIQLPGDGRFDYGWHQDGAYYTWAEQMITLWFPVNRPTNGETGTISVIPGSHREKIRKNETFLRHGYFKQIITEVNPAELQTEAMLDLALGDCCLMDGSLVHRSVSNNANSPRVAGVARIVSLPKHTYYKHDRFYCLHKP